MINDEGQPFEQLVEMARAAYESQDVEEQDEAYWDIVWLLAKRGDQETLDLLLPLTNGSSFERSFSISVLGRFGPTVRFHYDETGELVGTPCERLASAQIIDLLLSILEVESDEDVLGALVSSLGQHQEYDERIPPALSRFLDHHNADIRWFLAMGMGSYETPEAIEMLITLSTDEDTRVRDWATFGLGSLNSLDSSEIREALTARLDDDDAETRIEAIEGLALRGDARVVPIVLREFDDFIQPDQPYLPSERLLTALREMASARNYSGDRASLDAAIALCESAMSESAEVVRPVN